MNLLIFILTVILVLISNFYIQSDPKAAIALTIGTVSGILLEKAWARVK